MTRVRRAAWPDSVARVRAGRARWTFVVVIAGAIACGDASPEPSAQGEPGATSEAPAHDPASGDPLLARARASIAGGRVDPEVAAEIRASSDPAHARAARLLAAIAGDVAPTGPAAAEEPAPVGPPPVVPPAELDPEGEGDAPSDAPAEGTIVAPVAARATPAGDAPSSDTPRPKKSRPELSALSLAATEAGATLTIKAPGGVTVGVANQPSSGIVRLVIEGASATPKVVGARPKITGARVSGVRKGEDTVQITLQLDPGWRLANVKSFSGGARVNLVAP
jgi:hypothetical protein